jgi:hypothetical protein
MWQVLIHFSDDESISAIEAQSEYAPGGGPSHVSRAVVPGGGARLPGRTGPRSVDEDEGEDEVVALIQARGP